MPEFFTIDPKTLHIEAHPYSYYKNGRFYWFTGEGKRRSQKHDGFALATYPEVQLRMIEIKAIRLSMDLDRLSRVTSDIEARSAELAELHRLSWIEKHAND